MEPQTQPLVCKSHTAQFIGLFVIGIIVGLGLSLLFTKQTPAPAGENNTYQAGFNAAKKLVEESAFGNMLRTPDDVRSFGGTVAAVEGNRITIHGQLSMNPFEDPALNDRTVIVTTDTKIFKLTQKDTKTFQSEMEAFMKKMQKSPTDSSSALPPEPFTRTSSDVASITTGSQLNVTGAENIKTAKEFSASEIQIQVNQIQVN